MAVCLPFITHQYPYHYYDLVHLIMHCWSHIQYHPHFVFLAISIGITRGFRSIWQQGQHKESTALDLNIFTFILDRGFPSVRALKQGRTLAPHGQSAMSFYKRIKRETCSATHKSGAFREGARFCFLGEWERQLGGLTDIQ
jgi:hypothetical protein